MRYTCFLLAMLFSFQGVSQAFDAYGLDPLLHNGRIYKYHYPSGTVGHPYFQTGEFVNGSVRLRGVDYKNVSLKYDIVNQQLVYQYARPEGGVLHIVLSDAWMESFDVNGKHFEIFDGQDTIKHIFQVLGEGPARIGYAWHKELKLNMRMNSRNFVFNEAERKSYLVQGNGFKAYTSNKSFLALIDKRKQSRIKNYMTKNRINVKRASDQAMTQLISFYNNALTE